MKKFSILFVLILFGIQVQSFSGKTSKNNYALQQTETREVTNFSGISSGGHFNVFVKMGTTESLKIEADKEALERIETIVDNNILKIRIKNRLNGSNRDWNMGKVSIYITAKSLNMLAVSGSGSIKVDGNLNQASFNTTVSGSGSINFNADVKDLKGVISGSGSISAAGTATHTSITISGSGRFNGKNLKSKTADIRVSGSGGIAIHAEDQLNASLSGSGNIRYSGNARVNISKSGSGSVSKV